MKRKQIYLVVVSAAIVSLVVACVSASSLPNTPLYTLRMEQTSSKMNFLPTAMNEFTYTAEAGYTLGCDVSGGRGAILRGTDATCHPTCSTCPLTCDETCPDTCENTCPYTCDDPTCPDTCPVTCSTCQTCPYTVCTCYGSCYGSCVPTCKLTCASCDPECEPQE